MSKIQDKLYAYTSPILYRVPLRLRYAASTRIAVSTKFRFAYIRIPKAANSTITRTLSMFTHPGQENGILSDDSGAYAKRLFQNVRQTGCFTEECFFDNYYVFAFFRNPHSRLLSAYLDKIHSSRQNCESFRKHIEKQYGVVNFSNFIAYLEDGGLFSNAHWAPQTSLCPFPLEKLNYIGKIEELDMGMKKIISDIFVEEEFHGLLQRNQNRQFAGDKIDSFFTDSLRERVYELYKNDFERLAYD